MWMFTPNHVFLPVIIGFGLYVYYMTLYIAFDNNIEQENISEKALNPRVMLAG